MVYQSSTCLISGSESTTIEPTTGGPSGSTVTTTHPPTTTTDTNTTNALAIGGSVAAGLIIILVIIVLAVYCVRKKRNKMAERADESGMEEYGRKEPPLRREMAADEPELKGRNNEVNSTVNSKRHATNNDSHNQKTKEIATVPKTQNLHGTKV